MTDGRLLAIRLLNYITNQIINRLPSFELRMWWYRRVIGLDVGSGTLVYLGCYLWFYGPGQVRRSPTRIGNNTVINRRCCLDVRGPLTIGDNVSISPEVAIITTQHLLDAPDFPLDSREVVIEDNVWIGMRAMILPGSRIGRGAVVAAGAVVTGEVAPMTVVAGVPARPIGTRPEGAAEYVFNGPVQLLE